MRRSTGAAGPPRGMAGLRQRLRQRRFPPEFRIPAGYPAGAPVPRGAPEAPPSDTLMPAALMADLATNLWRLGRKLADETGETGRAGTRTARQRKAARHLRAAQDALAKAGVKTQDHDGTAFDIGLTLDVLAYQPVPGATRETVHETVRPSVYRDGRCIQMGQVIVAQPEGEPHHGTRDR